MPYAFQNQSVDYARTLLPEQFPTYRGLPASGQDWLQFRKAVNQVSNRIVSNANLTVKYWDTNSEF